MSFVPLALLGSFVLALPAAARVDDGDLAAQLRGAWREDAPDGRLLAFDGARSVQASGHGQSVYEVEYLPDAVVRTPLDGQGDVLREDVAFEKKRLVLTYPGGVRVTFERLAEMPIELVVDPFPLGARDPKAEERRALSEELQERRTKEQDVRHRLTAAMTAARADGRLDTPEDHAAFMAGEEMTALMNEMGAIDRDNRERLLELLLDVGWIDADRFDDRATDAAFLIVQHSGHLGLMQTVLPRLAAAAETDPALGQSYALLHDRTQLRLGRLQRYGTQLTPDAAGVLHVNDLEDPDDVDSRRATVGLPPLESYLDIFRGRGQQVVVDGEDESDGG